MAGKETHAINLSELGKGRQDIFLFNLSFFICILFVSWFLCSKSELSQNICLKTKKIQNQL